MKIEKPQVIVVAERLCGLTVFFLGLTAFLCGLTVFCVAKPLPNHKKNDDLLFIEGHWLLEGS